ncbi:MAG: hypothetical protein GY779_04390, partial [Gammaproteobacteria bacterium]|nr:hypothetical protein [Gammaproteobacteria bacterium]
MAEEDVNMRFAIVGDNPVDPSDAITLEQLREMDILGFQRVVKPFARRIRDSRDNTPFTVGVFADWGQGKSSLMKLLRRRLELDKQDERDPTVITVWFNPWKYHTREEAWRGLALTLVNEIQANDDLFKELNRKKPALKKFTAKLLWTHWLGKWGGELVDTISKEPWNPAHLHQFETTLKSLFETLQPKKNESRSRFFQWFNKSQPSSPKRLLVLFVDDLDRCTAEPAAAVLEAMKLVLDHPGVVTIMGVAQDELAVTLEKLYRAKNITDDNNGEDKSGEWGHRYLAKIIQIPFNVPHVAPKAFNNYIAKCLDDSRLTEQLPQTERWFPLMRRVCKFNLRDVKRFVNRFVIEWDKAQANLEVSENIAESRSLDVPRVVFMLLVDLQSPLLLPYCRSQEDPEGYFFSLQQQLLEEQERDAEPSDNDNQWETDEGLQKLFRECLNPPIAKGAGEGGQSLVRKFKFKHEVSTFLNFGYELLQQEQTTKAAPDSTETEQVKPKAKRATKKKSPTKTAEKRAVKNRSEAATAVPKPATEKVAPDSIETEEIEPKVKRATKKKPPTKTAKKRAVKNRKEAATAVPKAATDLQPVLREVRTMMRDGALSEAEGMLESYVTEIREDSQRAEVAALMAEIAILAGRPMAGAERYQSQTVSMEKSVIAEHSEGLVERLGDLLADSSGFGARESLRDEAGRALAHLFATTCEGEMPDQSVFEKQPANETLADLVTAFNPVYGTPKMRAALGRALAGLGDPRPGLGCKLDPKSKLLLPDFEWLKHPACRFHYQEAGVIDVAAFSLARYP